VCAGSREVFFCAAEELAWEGEGGEGHGGGVCVCEGCGDAMRATIVQLMEFEERFATACSGFAQVLRERGGGKLVIVAWFFHGAVALGKLLSRPRQFLPCTSRVHLPPTLPTPLHITTPQTASHYGTDRRSAGFDALLRHYCML
jgi:hypothetical protein